MRKLLVLLVLAAIGFGVWWWLNQRGAAGDDPFGPTDTVAQPAAPLPAAAKQAVPVAARPIPPGYVSRLRRYFSSLPPASP